MSGSGGVGCFLGAFGGSFVLCVKRAIKVVWNVFVLEMCADFRGV